MQHSEGETPFLPLLPLTHPLTWQKCADKRDFWSENVGRKRRWYRQRGKKCWCGRSAVKKLFAILVSIMGCQSDAMVRLVSIVFFVHWWLRQQKAAYKHLPFWKNSVLCPGWIRKKDTSVTEKQEGRPKIYECGGDRRCEHYLDSEGKR